MFQLWAFFFRENLISKPPLDKKKSLCGFNWKEQLNKTFFLWEISWRACHTVFDTCPGMPSINELWVRLPKHRCTSWESDWQRSGATITDNSILSIGRFKPKMFPQRFGCLYFSVALLWNPSSCFETFDDGEVKEEVCISDTPYKLKLYG